MDTTIVEGRSISKPPYFDGTANCTEWKERIKIFIQSVDFDLWLVIKNGPKIPKIMIDGIESEKSEDEFNGEDKKNVELEAKAKNILCCAINQDDFKRISSCQTAKEMWEELDREVTTSDINSTEMDSLQFFSCNSSPQVPSRLLNRPNLEFLEQQSDIRFLNLCVPTYKHALHGNWPAAKRIIDKEIRLRNAAIAVGWPTPLHIAAGANHIHFVKGLLKMLDDKDLALQDVNGNTAFCFAAAVGNMEIVDLMLERNSQLPKIRGENGYTPILYAALQGRCKMTWHLYDKTKDCFKEEDWKLLFFACIYTGIYDFALKLARDRNELAFVRDVNEVTALHLLARNLMVLDYRPEHVQIHIMANPGMKNHVVFQLVKFLWTTILEKHYSSKEELNKIINEPSQLIFDAAEVGNFGFLSELLSVFPSLIWDVDSKNRTILHIAVLHRHYSIFNFIHQIGHIKGIILTYENDEDRNTLLHLAAKLAPQVQLDLVCGAAFQMCLELLWFEVQSNP